MRPIRLLTIIIAALFVVTAIAWVIVDRILATSTPLPPQIYRSLGTSTEATIYATEPGDSVDYGGDVFHGVKVIDRIKSGPLDTFLLSTALKWSIGNAPIPLCAMSPHHALSFSSERYSYDFVICYECSTVDVMKDGRHIAYYSITDWSKSVLNYFLKSGHVAVTTEQLGADEQLRRKSKHHILENLRTERQAKSVQAWYDSMPKSIQDIWRPQEDNLRYQSMDLSDFQKVLSNELRDPDDQMISLLNWLGADNGIWARSKEPLYWLDLVPERLLSNFHDEQVIAMMKSGKLTSQQSNGLARYIVDRTGPLFDHSKADLRNFRHTSPELDAFVLKQAERTLEPSNAELGRYYFAAEL